MPVTFRVRVNCTMSCLRCFANLGGPSAEALERSRFNEIQDVLLMNQTERDILLSLMPMMLLLLCHMPRRILNIKLFSWTVKKNDKPIMDWTKTLRLSTINSGLAFHFM